MPDEAVTALAIPEPGQPLDRNPAAVYLSGLSKSGRLSMGRKLDRAANALGYPDAFSAPWGDLRFQHVTAVRTRLQEEDLAPSTVNCILHALRGVARAAYNLGLIESEEYRKIKDVKLMRFHRELAGRALSVDEVRRLFRACARDRRPQGRRDAALLEVFYATGVRRSEIVGIELADYNPDTGELLVHGKGDRERVVYIAGHARNSLDEWLTIRGDEPGALFVPINHGGNLSIRPMTPEAVYNRLRKRAFQAGVKRFSPHDLRRTFTTTLLEAGADPLTVSRFVGHANIQTTLRYDRRGEEAKRQLAELVQMPNEECFTHAT